MDLMDEKDACPTHCVRARWAQALQSSAQPARKPAMASATQHNHLQARSSAMLSFEAKLWLSVDKPRNNMGAADYKHG